MASGPSFEMSNFHYKGNVESGLGIFFGSYFEGRNLSPALTSGDRDTSG